MLYKIKEWIGLSYGVIETEYYLSKNKLVFAFVKEKHFKTVNNRVDYKITIPIYKGGFTLIRIKCCAQYEREKECGT
jgi:hypothetical protein